MDYFAVLRAFTRAVQLGSFSKVAAEDGLKVSTVSRHIRALEEDLGAAVFNRSTRRLHLTEVGSHFYEDSVRILAELEQAREAATSLNARPRGVLRINIPATFGRRHIAPHLSNFLTENPEIHLDAVLTDETVDLIATGTDLAVRIGTLADSTLIAKRLAPHHRKLVASPAYLAGRPAIVHPGDLKDHECLVFALQPKDVWYFRQAQEPGDLIEVPARGRLRASDSGAILEIARAGHGIALLPTWLTGEDVANGRLVILLPEWTALIALGPERAIWVVYPPKKVVPPKVKAFIAFLEKRFGKPPYWDRAAAPEPLRVT